MGLLIVNQEAGGDAAAFGWEALGINIVRGLNCLSAQNKGLLINGSF